jgi:hypothetical protein
VLGMSYYITDIQTVYHIPGDTTLSLPDVHYGDVCQTWLKIVPKAVNILYQTDYYFAFTDFHIYNTRITK